MNKVIVFYGSKRDFDSRLEKDEVVSSFTTFMAIIRDYNAKLRPMNTRYQEEVSVKKNIDVLVVRAEEFGSVLDHVIHNFISIITCYNDIDTLYLHNPPHAIVAAIEAQSEAEIEVDKTEYCQITRENLKGTYEELRNKVIGQSEQKRRLISTIYKSTGINYRKPIVVMLLGPSGVGKTETAKVISQYYGGELLRIQFSMMQNQEAYNYIFGAEHSRNSLARDLLGRETNIILIDEFDKVNSVFYNAFYQMFDEGVYVDTTYKVDLSNTIIICTSNFASGEEAREKLGTPIFSRFDAMIKYDYLSIDEKRAILTDIYTTARNRLHNDEQLIIDSKEIFALFDKNLERYTNVRSLKNSVEEAIYSCLFDVYICDVNEQTTEEKM